MKFIWLITIFLICLRLCFCFLRCNTSLPALPAFIQCLTDSHLREQTEGFHKKHTVPWDPTCDPTCDPTWTPGERRSRDPQTWDPLSLQFHFPSKPSWQTPPHVTSHSFAKPQHFCTWIILLSSYYYPKTAIDKFQFHYQDLDSSHWCIYGKNPNVILFPVF